MRKSMYTPANWYWVVGGDETKLWSSAIAAYVPATDATYTAWVAAGHQATRILNEAELKDVLAAAYPAGWPPTPAQQGQTRIAAGLAVTSTSGNWTATFPAYTDVTGANVWTLVLSEITALTASNNTVFADGQATVHWPDVTGALYEMNPAQFQAFAKAIGGFVALCRNFMNGVPNAALPPTTAVTIV